MIFYMYIKNIPATTANNICSHTIFFKYFCTHKNFKITRIQISALVTHYGDSVNAA